MVDLIVILTTMPDDQRADALARTLVEEHLAACVHVHAPASSVYRWKGAVERETERPMVVKTTRAMLPALEARLRALHPYEVPEFVVLTAEAGDAYGRWISDVVGSR
jgi:periplasmic divalent cation tolerance protein